MNRALSLVTCALLLAACGCRPEPLPEPELRARLAELGSGREAFSSITAAYDLYMAGHREDGRKGVLSCSGRMVAARDRGLRMQGEKALGMAKIFDFLKIGDSYRLHFIHGEKFYTGSVNRALASRGVDKLLGGRLDLNAVLFPVPRLDGQGAPEFVYGTRETRLVWPGREGEGRRVLIVDSAYARPLRTEFFDGRGARVAVLHYRKPVGCEPLRPVGGFKLRGGGRRGYRMDITLSKVKINVKLKDAAFRLNPPKGMEITDVDAGKPEEPAEPEGK
ncbi:MAG: hypothetical protein ACYTGB_07725 [Planctomycetota bacterium]|jgi:hypothetical protein